MLINKRSLYINHKLLTKLEIPDSIMSIGNYVFNGCTSLISITIPSRVTSIDENAFYNCYKLVEIYNLSSVDIIKGAEEHGYVAYCGSIFIPLWITRVNSLQRQKTMYSMKMVIQFILWATRAIAHNLHCLKTAMGKIILFINIVYVILISRY